MSAPQDQLPKPQQKTIRRTRKGERERAQVQQQNTGGAALSTETTLTLPALELSPSPSTESDTAQPAINLETLDADLQKLFEAGNSESAAKIAKQMRENLDKNIPVLFAALEKELPNLAIWLLMTKEGNPNARWKGLNAAQTIYYGYFHKLIPVLEYLRNALEQDYKVEGTLPWACNKNDVKAVTRLLKEGADVNQLTLIVNEQKNNTEFLADPLTIAMLNGNKVLCNLLVAAGAKLHIINAYMTITHADTLSKDMHRSLACFRYVLQNSATQAPKGAMGDLMYDTFFSDTALLPLNNIMLQLEHNYTFDKFFTSEQKKIIEASLYEAIDPNQLKFQILAENAVLFSAILDFYRRSIILRKIKPIISEEIITTLAAMVEVNYVEFTNDFLLIGTDLEFIEGKNTLIHRISVDASDAIYKSFGKLIFEQCPLEEKRTITNILTNYLEIRISRLLKPRSQAEFSEIVKVVPKAVGISDKTDSQFHIEKIEKMIEKLNLLRYSIVYNQSQETTRVVELKDTKDRKERKEIKEPKEREVKHRSDQGSETQNEESNLFKQDQQIKVKLAQHDLKSGREIAEALLPHLYDTASTIQTLPKVAKDTATPQVIQATALLFAAIKLRLPNLALYLISEHKADPHRTWNGLNALEMAYQYYNSRFIQLIPTLLLAFDIKQDHVIVNTLAWACAQGNFSAVQRILEKPKTNANEFSLAIHKYLVNPLILAILYPNKRICNLLIAHGAKLNLEYAFFMIMVPGGLCKNQVDSLKCLEYVLRNLTVDANIGSKENNVSAILCQLMCQVLPENSFVHSLISTAVYASDNFNLLQNYVGEDVIKYVKDTLYTDREFVKPELPSRVCAAYRKSLIRDELTPLLKDENILAITQKVEHEYISATSDHLLSCLGNNEHFEEKELLISKYCKMAAILFVEAKYKDKNILKNQTVMNEFINTMTGMLELRVSRLLAPRTKARYIEQIKGTQGVSIAAGFSDEPEHDFHPDNVEAVTGNLMLQRVEFIESLTEEEKTKQEKETKAESKVSEDNALFLEMVFQADLSYVLLDKISKNPNIKIKQEHHIQDTLAWACFENKLEIVKKLLSQKDTGVHQLFHYNGCIVNALMLAIFQGHKDVCSLLMAERANLNLSYTLMLLFGNKKNARNLHASLDCLNYVLRNSLVDPNFKFENKHACNFAFENNTVENPTTGIMMSAVNASSVYDFSKVITKKFESRVRRKLTKNMKLGQRQGPVNTQLILDFMHLEIYKQQLFINVIKFCFGQNFLDNLACEAELRYMKESGDFLLLGLGENSSKKESIIRSVTMKRAKELLENFKLEICKKLLEVMEPRVDDEQFIRDEAKETKNNTELQAFLKEHDRNLPQAERLKLKEERHRNKIEALKSPNVDLISPIQLFLELIISRRLAPRNLNTFLKLCSLEDLKMPDYEKAVHLYRKELRARLPDVSEDSLLSFSLGHTASSTPTASTTVVQRNNEGSPDAVVPEEKKQEEKRQL